MDKSENDDKNCHNIGFNSDHHLNFLSERKEFLNGKLINDKVRIKAPSLCRAFIGGEWLSAEDSDIQFCTVGGGFTNKLYHCGLPELLKNRNNKNSDVLIRVYGGWHEMIGEVEMLIAQLLSDLKLGPKLLGVFPGGRLEEFIHSKTLTNSDLRQPLYNKAVARKLATIHKVEAPMVKNPDYIKTIKKYLKMAREDIFIEDVEDQDKELALEFRNFDFETEVSWLESAVKKVHSPFVFCHNDLLGPNILAKNNFLDQIKDLVDADNEILDQLILIIDFEFCSYNHRAFDIGNHFSERSIEYTHDCYPNFIWNSNDYPSEEEQRMFIRAYLEKWLEINNSSTSEFDTEDHLMQEVAVYRLMANLNCAIGTMASWCWSQNMPRSLGLWEYAKCRLQMYLQQKDEFLKSGFNLIKE